MKKLRAMEPPAAVSLTPEAAAQSKPQANSKQPVTGDR
jgi:hypothetical protein